MRIPTFKTTTIQFNNSDNVEAGELDNGTLKPISEYARAAVNFGQTSLVSSVSFKAKGPGTARLSFTVDEGGVGGSYVFNLTPGSWLTFSHTTAHTLVKSVTLEIDGDDAASRADDLSITFREINKESTQNSQVCNSSTHKAMRDGEVASNRAISLRYGEKRETVTDLRINTPSEPLTFTRYYRQFRQGTLRGHPVPGDGSFFKLMGSGWSHNHHYDVESYDLGFGRKQIAIQMPDGGEIFFLYDPVVDPQPNVFNGEKGLQAKITELIGETDEYFFLEMLNGEKYYFWVDGRVSRRIFPSGDSWHYHYQGASNSDFPAPNAFDDKLLKKVEDNYGNHLLFTYWNTVGTADEYKHRMLKRVTDHTGRYVEPQYELHPGGVAVLKFVRDARGKNWRYDYETTARSYDNKTLYFLRRVVSPQMACSSNNYSATGNVFLKELQYPGYGAGQMTELNQLLGFENGTPLRQETYKFFPSPTAARTEVTVSGRTTKHHFDYGVYYGVEDPLDISADADAPSESYQLLDGEYRVTNLITLNDSGEQTTTLSWGTKFLDKIQAAENEITEFKYQDENSLTGVLEETKDAIGRTTVYQYGYRTGALDTGPRSKLPTVVRTYRGDSNEILLIERHFLYNTEGKKRYEFVFSIDPALGPVQLPQDWNASTTNEDRLIFYNSGAISARMSQKIEYTYYGTTNPASYERNGMLQAVIQWDVANPADAVTTTYFYDQLGRVVKTQKSSLFGSCQRSYRIYDAGDNVVATICGNGDLPYPLPTTVAQVENLYNPSNPDAYHVTVYVYDEMSRLIEERMNVGSPLAQSKLTYYDAMNRVTRTISNYKAVGSTNPGLWAWNGTNKRWQAADSTPVPHGPNNDRNIVELTQYNDIGQIKRKQDVVNNLTLFGYTDGGKLKKVIQNATPLVGLNETSLNNYTEDLLTADQDVTTRYRYYKNGDVKKVILHNATPYEQTQEFTYDGMHRPLNEFINQVADTATPDEKMKPDRNGTRQTDYDLMGRVIRRRTLIDNRPSVNGDLQKKWRSVLYGYDDLDRVVRTIAQPYFEDYPFDPLINLEPDGDPDLSEYPVAVLIGTPSERNQITDFTYDKFGRIATEKTPAGVRTEHKHGTDSFGRYIQKTVNSGGGTTDPNTGAYIPNPAADRDLITMTYYNADGLVQRVKDPLDRWTLYAYDSEGRVIRTIQNAVNYAMTGVLPDLSNYGPLSTESDKDLLTTTRYDILGRVEQVTDKRNNSVFYVYDELNRKLMTIQNYVAQGTSLPKNWVWANNQWENGAGAAIAHGDNDQNIITTTRYDVLGRTVATRDSAGRETRFVYDKMGRQISVIRNYLIQGATQPENWKWSVTNNRWESAVGTAVNHNAPFLDRNLITTTRYNKAGHVVERRDPRGFLTLFTNDLLGRPYITQDPTGVKTYTCYDKLGQVLRTIQNYQPGTFSPDAKVDENTWAFAPTDHGVDKDVNLITEFKYDLAGRRIKTIDPEGNVTSTVYGKDDQVATSIEPISASETVATEFGYDAARRLKIVVQNFVPRIVSPRVSDVERWKWNTNRWEDEENVAIVHGGANDQNIIVQMTYDKGGRVRTQRNAEGKVTSYDYDLLDRRDELKNPLLTTWTTQYSDLAGGKTRATMTYPGLATGGAYNVIHEFDRLGRLAKIDYPNATTTPDVDFKYDLVSNRSEVIEKGTSGTTIRKTRFFYDAANRPKEVGFDANGDNVFEKIVLYSHNVGGLRTNLVYPDGKTVNYEYDARGQLDKWYDWGTPTVFTDVVYDKVGRLQQINRPNNLKTRYDYTPASRLKQLKHYVPNGGSERIIGLIDYWEIDARGNRIEVREQFEPVGGGALQQRTLRSTYDKIARLKTAKYYSGLNTGAPLFRDFSYTYDRAGNRLTQYDAYTTQSWVGTYNGANQLVTEDGQACTYDLNGNIVTDRLHFYTYDQANRMTQSINDGGGNPTKYRYDGMGNLIRQEVPVYDADTDIGIYDYILDLASNLPVVLQSTMTPQPTGTQRLTSFLHGPTGIVAQQEHDLSWKWMAQDGLGSVRSVLSNTLAVLNTPAYNPYGEELTSNSPITPFGFTGEMELGDGLFHLRARAYQPRTGILLTRDPWEGTTSRPMSINGYSYVEGNPINWVDPSGKNKNEYTAQWLNKGGCSSNLSKNNCYNFCRFEKGLVGPDLAACIVVCEEDQLSTIRQQKRQLKDQRRKQVLDEALKLRDQAMKGEITDFEALAATADYACQSQGVTATGVINDLSWIYAGSEGVGSLVESLLEATIFKTELPINQGLPSGASAFGGNPLGSGLHPDYEDFQNQVYHFIPHASTVASGGTVGVTLAYFGIVVHEDFGIPDFSHGSSWQDKNLSLAGMELGALAKLGEIQPCEVGDWIRNNLTTASPFHGFSQSTDEYPWIKICKILGLPSCEPSVP